MCIDDHIISHTCTWKPQKLRRKLWVDETKWFGNKCLKFAWTQAKSWCNARVKARTKQLYWFCRVAREKNAMLLIKIRIVFNKIPQSFDLANPNTKNTSTGCTRYVYPKNPKPKNLSAILHCPICPSLPMPQMGRSQGDHGWNRGVVWETRGFLRFSPRITG